jgi:hypothetical protein
MHREVKARRYECLSGRRTFRVYSPGDEALAVDFFELEDLSPLSTARMIERMLKEVFAHAENSNRATAINSGRTICRLRKQGGKFI